MTERSTSLEQGLLNILVLGALHALKMLSRTPKTFCFRDESYNIYCTRK